MSETEDHCTPSAILKVPSEVIQHIIMFCQHSSLTNLYQTNQAFRATVLKAMHTRILGLNLANMSRIKSPRTVFNIWTALTKYNSCTVCGTGEIAGTNNCKKFLGSIICEGCFMERIQSERFVISECDDDHCRITMNGESLMMDYDESLTHLQSEAYRADCIPDRVDAYFEMLDAIWTWLK